MHITGIIPARYGSTRFPGKPLADLAGKSLIRRVYERARQYPRLQELYVATDDSRIYAHVQSFGGRVLMTSTAHRSGTERCAEVLDQLGSGSDLILNIQGDEPRLAPAHLDALIDCFEQSSATRIATLVKAISDPGELHSPHIPKVVLDEGRRALYFSRQAIPSLAGLAPELWMGHHTFWKHIGLYAYRSEVLRELVRLPETPLERAEQLEQLRWLEHGYSIQVGLCSVENLAIDTPEDLEKYLRHYPDGGDPIH